MASIGNAFRFSSSQAFTTGGSATIYTVPSGKFAIVSLIVDSTGMTALTIGGQNWKSVASPSGVITGLYLGEGQSISVTGGSVKGVAVEFANT